MVEAGLLMVSSCFALVMTSCLRTAFPLVMVDHVVMVAVHAIDDVWYDTRDCFGLHDGGGVGMPGCGARGLVGLGVVGFPLRPCFFCSVCTSPMLLFCWGRY